MPSKKHLNGIANTLVQQYLSSTFYHDPDYVIDWIWDIAVQKNHKQINIDIINEKATPVDFQIKPIVGHLSYLRFTAGKILTAAGFDKDFMVEAKFDILISLSPLPTLLIEATLVDADGKIYKSKKYEDKVYTKNATPKTPPVLKPSLIERIKNIFNKK